MIYNNPQARRIADAVSELFSKLKSDFVIGLLSSDSQLPTPIIYERWIVPDYTKGGQELWTIMSI
jgi:hypothetical protein